jgi:hypothetical protein
MRTVSDYLGDDTLASFDDAGAAGQLPGRPGAPDGPQGAGWAKHPNDPAGSQRYFDGHQWTSSYVPPPVEADKVAVTVPDGQKMVVVGPPRWLWGAVAAVLLVCAGSGFAVGKASDERTPTVTWVDATTTTTTAPEADGTEPTAGGGAETTGSVPAEPEVTEPATTAPVVALGDWTGVSDPTEKTFLNTLEPLAAAQGVGWAHSDAPVNRDLITVARQMCDKVGVVAFTDAVVEVQSQVVTAVGQNTDPAKVRSALVAVVNAAVANGSLCPDKAAAAQQWVGG